MTLGLSQRLDMARALSIGNPPITVQMRRSKAARRLLLRVSRLDGRVTLTLPPRAPERQALAFLQEREDWLRGHLRQVAPAQLAGVGSAVLVEGRDREVRSGPVRKVMLTEDTLILPEGAGAPAILAFLKLRARDRLAEASDRFAAQVGRRYTKLTLRDTRSRWGSCTSAVGHAIRPREAVAAALHLFADYRAAGFGDCVEAAAGKLGDQAGLARTGAARHDEETVAHGPSSSGLIGKALRSDQHATGADQSSKIFRRDISNRLRGRGKFSDEKGRTIWCISRRDLVEPRGIEPLTSCMPCKRSPS